MNLNLLRSLQILIEEQHVSRAALRLHITQSAMSRQLAQLRTLFADELLVRDGNQLLPTAKALELKEKLDFLLNECDGLLNDKPFTPENWKGEFVFSSSDYVAQYLFPKLAQKVESQAPRLNLAYRLWDPAYLRDFDHCGIDLASTMTIGREAPKGLKSTLLGTDSSVCLARQDHPVFSAPITAKRLTSFSHVAVTGGGDKNTHIDVALKTQGEQRRVALKLPFFSAAVNTLLESDYVLVVPEHIAKNLSSHALLSYQPLAFATDALVYWLIWHPKVDNDPAHQWIRHLLLSIMQSSRYSIGHDLKS
ncbi:LysR family transcriptional regulator [Vibrio sp. AK197]